ncbi:MAG TPA: hypothetical protein VLE96_04470 [Chlamydiales bacterium]|nr:hypothetical protein [Chlamydiales bacterium]
MNINSTQTGYEYIPIILSFTVIAGVSIINKIARERFGGQLDLATRYLFEQTGEIFFNRPVNALMKRCEQFANLPI